MADLVTRIIAEDKQFNDKIERSKKQTKEFGEVGNIAKGALLKLTGAMGLAATAAGAFKKIIDSTQSNTDKFNSVMEQAKTSVDFFFDSIAVGDFKNFFSGLDGAITRARNLYDVMDTLGDMQAGWGDVENEYRTKINENIATIYDSDTPLEDRKKLMEENRQYIAMLEKKSKGIVAQTASAVVATAGRESQMDNVTEADVKRYLQEISLHDDPQFYDYFDKRSDLEKRSKETAGSTMSGNWGAVNMTQPTEAAVVAKQQLEYLKANNTELEKYYRINELISDEKRTEIVQLRAQGRAIDNNISQLKRQQATVERRYGKTPTGAVGSVAEIIPQGSIAEIEKQIATVKKDFMNATTDEARRAADELIKVLEARKAFVEIQFRYPSGVGDIPVPVKSLLNISGKKDVSGVDMSGVVQDMDYTPVATYSDYISEAARNSEDLTSSLYGVSDAMSSLSNVVGEGAGAWLQYGASVLQAVGQGIPAIVALTAAKKAEATANTASAATGAASAVAGIPIVGPILAIAAVASIIASLANLPKFATGGIVPGGSFSGDNMLARVNSGELILNKAQQSNLAGALSGGGGNVRFEIEGKKLVGILSNEEVRNSRR